MTKTPNYELTPGEVRNPFKPNDSGSLKKFKNEDVLITTETVRAYLDGKVANPDFKVGGLFYSKIEAQLNALDKKASPKAIAEAISTGLDNFDASSYFYLFGSMEFIRSY